MRMLASIYQALWLTYAAYRYVFWFHNLSYATLFVGLWSSICRLPGS